MNEKTSHNLYQKMFLKDIENYFGKENMLNFLEKNEEYLKNIYSLRTCFWHRRGVVTKKYARA